MKTIRIGALAIVVVILAFAGGYGIGRRSAPSYSQALSTIRGKGDDVINPIIDIDVPESIGSGPLGGIIDTIQEAAHSIEASGDVDDVGVYFRDLKEGSWYGYNEQERFAPASLLKVPLMIAYLKLSEVSPETLLQKISYDDTYPLSDQNLTMDFHPEREVQKGNAYTVQELLNYMIVYSDNNAKNLLYLHIDQERLASVYRDLGMQGVISATGPTDSVLSPKENAAAYRVLYNATYLSPENSRKAIELLLGDRFTSGIVAGLPKGVRYAGKYGERSYKGTRQLHDCGIVYYPKHPYILCIMTRGSNYEELAQSLEQLSSSVYQAVAAAHK